MPDVLFAQGSDEMSDNAVFDEEALVTAAARGDACAMEQLVNHYKGYVKACSQSYFLMGADRDDVIQEGMIGLYKAVLSYKPERGVGFKAFAGLCIKRQIVSAVKSAKRQKHIPLNTCLSLDGEDGVVFPETVNGRYASGHLNPEQIMIEKENLLGMKGEINRLLSDFELKVLLCYLSDMPYSEIARCLGREPKAVDNALQRMKKKLEKLLNQ